MHPNLRTAGALPSLDMPHHPRSDEWCDYREGVVVSEDDEVITLYSFQQMERLFAVEI